MNPVSQAPNETNKVQSVQGSMEPDPLESPTRGAAAPQPSSSSLIFLGTGCSGALPDTWCLLKPSTPPCDVCSMGVSLPPERNPNYRCTLYFYGQQIPA